MAPTAYFNGRFCSETEIALSWQDAGLVFGATTTDLVRTFGHQLFLLNDHLARFQRSCNLCRIPLQASATELATIAERVVRTNVQLISSASELALVMLATPGPLARFTGQDVDGPPTLAMHSYPLSFDRYRHLFTEGARLIIATPRQVPASSMPASAKQRSRLNWWMASCEAKSVDPNADALLLDHDGHVTETASANLIAVFGNQLVTPPNCLPGVSLNLVRQLALTAGFQFQERLLTPANCRDADELILTSTTFCIAGVSRFHDANMRWPGPAYQNLLAAYSNLVGVDISAQIRTNY